jgi:hypothetical protein
MQWVEFASACPEITELAEQRVHKDESCWWEPSGRTARLA